MSFDKNNDFYYCCANSFLHDFKMNQFTNTMKNLLPTLIILLCIVFSPKAQALDYYWVGGSGNWSDINHWSAVSGNTPMQLHTITPTSNDNIILDSLSFPSTGGTININLNIAFCKNLIVRDLPSNVNIQFYGGSDVLRIFGDILISDTIGWTGNGKIMLEGTGTRIIQTSGLALPNLYLNSIGTTWLVSDSLRVGDFYAENGTLDLQGNLFHCDEIEVLNFSALKLDSAEVQVKNKYFVDVNTTLDCHMADIVIYGVPLTHPNYNIPFFKDLSNTWHKYNSVSILESTGDIYNENHFYGHDSCLINRLHFYQDAEIQGTLTADTLVLDSSSTMRIETNSNLTFKHIVAHGNCAKMVEIQALGLGSKAVINHVSNLDTANFVRIRDINVLGTPWHVNHFENVNNSSTGITGQPQNSGQKYYWIQGSGNWEDANHWSITEGGAPAGCIPGAMDTIIISDSSSTNVLTITMPDNDVNISSLFVSLDSSMAMVGANRPIILDGTLDLDSNVELGAFRPIRFTGTDSSYYIKTSSNRLGIVTFMSDGLWTVTDDLTATRIHHIDGTLDITGRTIDCIHEFEDVRSDDKILSFSAYSPKYLADSSIIKTPSFIVSNNQATASTTGSKIWIKTDPNKRPQYSNWWYRSLRSITAIQWDTLYVDSSSYKLEASGVNNFNVAQFYSDANLNCQLITDSVFFDAGNKFRCNALEFNAIKADGNCWEYIDFEGYSNGAAWDAAGTNHNVSYSIFKNVNVSNGTVVASNSFDNSSNSGITFSNAANRTLYWVGGNGDWSDSTHWSLSSGGTPGECLPTPVDSAVFDDNSATNSSVNVTLNNNAYCGDFIVTANAPYLTLNYSSTLELNVHGSLYINRISNISAPLNLRAYKSNEVLETKFSYIRDLRFYADSSQYLISDSLRVGDLNQYSGSIIGNGNYMSISRYWGRGDSLENVNGVMRFNDAWVFNYWDVTNSQIKINSEFYLSGNIDAQLSDIELFGSSPSLVFNSADTLNNVVYSNGNGIGEFRSNLGAFINNMTFKGDGIVRTNSQCDTLVFSNGHSYFIDSNKTVNVQSYFDCDGDFCNPILIRSIVQGVQANIYLQDTLSGEFLEIRDINSSGPAPFYAGSKSADQGNNTNIIWANKPGYVWGFGPDKYLITCDGSSNDSIILPTDGFEDALGFTWFDGSTGSTYITNAEGVYWVEANYGGCNVPDTIAVFYDTISLELTSTYFCTGDTMSLAPVRDTFLSHVTLLWNDGSTDADKSFLVTADTTVWVQVEDSFGKLCTDTIHSSLVSSDLLPDSLSLLNCYSSLLDTSALANLIGALPDSLWYTLKSNYDTLNNMYDGMVELSALFNTCVITDSIYIKLDSVGSVTPQKNAFCPATWVTWGNTHVSSDFTPVWFNGISAQSVSQQVWIDSAVYFYRMDDLGNICADTLRYSIDSNLVSAALSSWSSSPSTNVLAPYADTIQGNVYGEGNSYFWIFNGIIQDSGVGTFDTLVLNLVDTGWYNIGFIAYDSLYGGNCNNYAFLNYFVSAQAGSYIPNAFSPNGDNINDFWIPVVNSSSPQSIVTKIYDSYGNKVFESSGAAISWDGTNPNGVNCNAGTHIVQCSYTDLSGNSVQSITYLTLIR